MKYFILIEQINKDDVFASILSHKGKHEFSRRTCIKYIEQYGRYITKLDKNIYEFYRSGIYYKATIIQS